MRVFMAIGIFAILSCNNASEKKPVDQSERYQAKNKSTQLSCGLSSPELKARKETVLTSLRKQVLEKKELPNGFAFKFSGSDRTIDELFGFIRTERECCNFFVFNLSISGDKSEAWLELTGAEGAK